MPYRRCIGCKKFGYLEVPMGGGYICDGCAHDFGTFGGKPRNVAEKNSKEYRATKLCKGGRHNDVDVSRYSKGGRHWEKGTCKRCGAIVYDAKF
jgi:hypothetical protein